MNDLDYKVPFRFNGTIDKLTFKLGPTQLAEADHMKMQVRDGCCERLGPSERTDRYGYVGRSGRSKYQQILTGRRSTAKSRQHGLALLPKRRHHSTQ